MPEVVDPGGRLQDIADPELRRAVARLRGTRGKQKQIQARVAGQAQPAAASAAENGSVEVDAAVGRAELRRLVQKAKSEQVKMQAARALASLDAASTVTELPALSKLRELTPEELVDLLAQPWPAGREPRSAQG